MSKQLKITWTRSIIGCPETQRRTIRSLGLRKMQQSIIKEDSPQIRGQIKKVQHLVTVEEIE
ncbi:MAG: 50S ribosomal protein L30 [Syntrophomonadaceae bacterium]